MASRNHSKIGLGIQSMQPSSVRLRAGPGSFVDHDDVQAMARNMSEKSLKKL